ncbi:AAA family ATPase [Agromyces archimandritae]|uniref:AAA family ATPase n=2 Tax=Agromyces archimandritae TaxID=2781962 RepID=A0A975IPR0_9MICO|nr:AAA family ATPase [Agromyces archimandritae]
MPIVLTRGIPGSGKTTMSTALVADHSNRFMRINRDDIRRMCFGGDVYADPGRARDEGERMVSLIEVASARYALEQGFIPVIDATSLNPGYLVRWTGMAGLLQTPLVVWDFPIGIEEAIRRDAARPHPVGADVIRAIAGAHLDEGGALPAVPAGALRASGIEEVMALVSDTVGEPV